MHVTDAYWEFTALTQGCVKTHTGGSWSWPTTAVALVSFLKKRKQKKPESPLSTGPLRAARNQTCMSYEAGREALCHTSSLESWIQVWEEAKKELGQLPGDGSWHRAGQLACLACLKRLQNEIKLQALPYPVGTDRTWEVEKVSPTSRGHSTGKRLQETRLKLGCLTVYNVKCNLTFF